MYVSERDVMRFEGYIRDVRYRPQMIDALHVHLWDDFDINAVRGAGIIQFDTPHDVLLVSRWISPKRTRSYPFARLYSGYAHNGRIVTVIPVIKDEGAAGDNDRINAMTFSWMSLMNIYIVLAWYDQASPARASGKITRQRLNAPYVREQIAAVRDYKASALHWNTSHFLNNFESVFMRAVERYQAIGELYAIPMHSPTDHMRVLEKYRVGGIFNLEQYRMHTLFTSAAAAQREVGVSHMHERLDDGEKALFRIENYLGGQYFLTADEVFREGDVWVIQEAKHSTRTLLPKNLTFRMGCSS
jgi:hypothetical protein